MVAPNSEVTGRPRPRVVTRTPNPTPPGGTPPGGAGGGSNPYESDPTNTRPGVSPVAVYGGGGQGGPDRMGVENVARQASGSNVQGATPFMQTPGMQIASQRVSGQAVRDDPAISAALTDFNNRIAPQIQNRATLSGLGRSTAALNAVSSAQGQMLAPMYESAFGREQQRLGNMNTAAENELGRGERSSARVADANQNMVQNLMGLSNTMYGRGQSTGQNLMGAGGQLRDIGQQGNEAGLNDFLRRQALGEQAVYAPFGGLASAGLGSTSSTTGK